MPDRTRLQNWPAFLKNGNQGVQFGLRHRKRRALDCGNPLPRAAKTKINQMRAEGHSVEDSAIQGSVRGFRPVIMAMLVASLGLLPAALSHGIGSDSQRPFAIVIVGGLMGVLLICVLLLPALYVGFARAGDKVGDVVVER
jgi:hypothetical protein